MECKDGICYIKSYKQCKNYIVCKNNYNEMNEGFCIDCFHLFGEWRNRKRNKVEVKENKETCPLCKENEQYIVYRIDCDHNICVDCFRKIYFGIEYKKPVLSFSITSKDDYKENLEKWSRLQNIYKSGKLSSLCCECIID